jgi:1,4-dihydroxy-2-naphthoyl-CoA hydrolase
VSYHYDRTVRMADTDASGVIYFAAVQKIALETFEDFLLSSGYELAKMMLSGPLLMPIVHVEADYLAPVHVGELLRVEMKLAKTGVTSFVLKYNIFSSEHDLVVATLAITHVVITKDSKKSVPIPQELLSILERAKS